MDSIHKISSVQIYMLWKNISVSLLVLIVLLTMSKLFQGIGVSLGTLACAAFLYTYIYYIKERDRNTCLIIPYSVFICIIIYTFGMIALNILALWHIKFLPNEFYFLNTPYLPVLSLLPTCFFVSCFFYFRRRKLRMCVDCQMRYGTSKERGYLGAILNYESHLQLKNLIILFGCLSVLVWVYYLVFYIKINANARDWYIYTWMTVIAFLLDEVYFIFRYYNLYLDLRENDEIISESEILNMGAQTYLRYYVICGNKLYVDPHSVDSVNPFREVLDTPFQTKRAVNGIPIQEVKQIIVQMTGIADGDIRFFFGRKSETMPNSSLLRYFYFVEKHDSESPQLRTEGEWMDFDQLKSVYSNSPSMLSTVALTDTTRLATIILTAKTFDENGNRKNRLKAYRPTFNLNDVRKSDLDFQDDKWIRVSLFNSDTPMFKFKRWWRNITRHSVKQDNRWDL